MQTRNAPGAEPVQVPANAAEAANLVRDIHTQVAEIRSMAEGANANSGETRATIDRIAAQVVALEEGHAQYQRERLARANDPDVIRARPSQARAALEHFMRTGELTELETVRAVRNELNDRSVAGATSVNTTGGYLVLPELDAQIDRIARQFSGLRRFATVKPIGTTRYEKRRKISGTDANWEGEAETVASTDAMKFGVIAIDTFGLRSEPEYSVESLEDPFINMEAEIADDLGEAFGKKEADAHINGNGEKKPVGILKHAQAVQAAPNSEIGWNKVGLVKTGQAATFGASGAEGDIFRQIPFYLRSEFQPGAAFFMNRKTLSQLVVFKDTNGAYVWSPSLRDGTPQQLAGYGVNVLEEMPDLAAGATPVAFGDMAQAYLILDRVGLQILRNPYRTSGQVTFFARKRVGGGVRKGEALKLIKVAA